jgi:integrase
MTDELVSKNVAGPVKLPPVRSPRRRAWSGDEARRLLESAKLDDDPLHAAYVLVLVLGLRKGEVLGLTWDDVDLYSGTLSVGLQLQRVRRELLHRQTKTERSEFTLPLPPICHTALQRHKTQQDRAQDSAGKLWHATGLVFSTRYGRPIEPRNFSRSYDTRIAKAGVRRITVHDARRTCGTLLADLDVHPRVAMAILRHARFSITMEIYTQVSDEQTRAALRKLGDSLDG